MARGARDQGSVSGPVPSARRIDRHVRTSDKYTTSNYQFVTLCDRLVLQPKRAAPVSRASERPWTHPPTSTWRRAP